MVAVGSAGFLFGHLSADPRPPATLAQAIEEATAGRLPVGGPAPGVAGPATPPASTAPIDAQPTLTFRGTVEAAPAGRLVVDTQAGPVTVALDGRTRFSTVEPAADHAARSVLGRSVIVVPATPAPGQAPGRAAVVVVLP